MRNTLQFLLKVLARATLRRYKPRVVCVTGNVGKTSAKDAIATVLAARFFVRKSEKNYNTQIGVPITILGIAAWERNAPGWLWDIARACARLIWTRYPDILVLEMGVDRPGDMEYLLTVARPNVAVFTASGDIPVHVEHFIDAEALHAEKRKLAAAVPQNGAVVVNADVSAWSPLMHASDARCISYGFAHSADVALGDPEIRFDGAQHSPAPLGIAFKVQYKGSTIPVRLNGTVSNSGAYAAGAAFCVGIAFGMNGADIAAALGRYVPPKGRLNIVSGMKGSLILDDSYNASPTSMNAALATLAALPAKRKIAVLGDMLELGAHAEAAHRMAGEKAADICNVAILVGGRMKFAEDELVARGFIRNQNIFHRETSQEAAETLVRIIESGDLILVKGSHGMRMEKIVGRVAGDEYKAHSSSG